VPDANSTPDHQPQTQGELYARLERLLDWPMMVLALIFLVALVAEIEPSVPANWSRIAAIVDWSVWGIFAAEYLFLLALATDRRHYFRTHLFQLVAVVIPALRIVRLLRAFGLVRLLYPLRGGSSVSMAAREWSEIRHLAHRRGVAFAGAGVVVVLLVGAYVMYLVEHPTNQSFASYGLALWWALVTMTTVGYGDASPQTVWGRVVAGVFMVVGIGVFGIVSATIAAHFIHQDTRSEMATLNAKLDRLTEALDRLEHRGDAPTEDDRDN
jgi:voltage-gated potassium channel